MNKSAQGSTRQDMVSKLLLHSWYVYLNLSVFQVSQRVLPGGSMAGLVEAVRRAIPVCARHVRASVSSAGNSMMGNTRHMGLLSLRTINLFVNK